MLVKDLVRLWKIDEHNSILKIEVLSNPGEILSISLNQWPEFEDRFAEKEIMGLYFTESSVNIKVE